MRASRQRREEPGVGVDATVDILVIGGGINGAGIARDAAGRGLSVVLCEQGDLAAATSSASSKLIHGGLRYLEHYEFRLVREALAEREILLGIAPHLIFPMRFVLPHERSLRPAWMIRAGLFLYDHIGKRRKLPGSHSVDLRADPVGGPLRPEYRKGFVYSDCWVDDARLVVLNVLDAAAHGAIILTRNRCVTARRHDRGWRAVLRDLRTGAQRTVESRILVNSAGPWVDRVLDETIGVKGKRRVRLIKGSHIVVPRLYDGDHAYILQNADRRVIFVIPYERDFSLIGTTDESYSGDLTDVRIDPEETTYLCETVSRSFTTRITPDDVVWSYSGVRPLYDDAAESAAKVTRDYVLELDDAGDNSPLLTVYGGKLTTYRRLAEHALDKLKPNLPAMEKPWTATAPLPGGNIPSADFERFLDDIRRRCPWLPDDLAYRYARAYGTRIEALLDGARSLAELGRDFGAGLYEREVAYLVDNEWAETAVDILWRRTKRGLHVPSETAASLEAWLAGRNTSRRQARNEPDPQERRQDRR